LQQNWHPSLPSPCFDWILSDCTTRAADLLQVRADLEGRSLSNLIANLLEAPG